MSQILSIFDLFESFLMYIWISTPNEVEKPYSNVARLGGNDAVS
jgi:hypothetical protein